MDWQQWFRQVKRELYQNSPYELRFAQTVMRRVDGLDFAKVQTQTSFKDSDGRDRRIDFTIAEGERVRIAIEVDGYDKTASGTGMTREQHRDYAFRERAIVENGWTLLRFANAELKDPARCAAQIESALRVARAEAQALVHASARPAALRSEQPTRGAFADAPGPWRQPTETGVSATRRPKPGLRLTLLVAAAGLAISLTVLVSGGDSDLTRPTFVPNCGTCASWDDAISVLGEEATVHGPIRSVRHIATAPGAPTFVSVGAPYPSPDRFEFVIWDDVRSMFAAPPEELFESGTICGRGLVVTYEDHLEIQIDSPPDLGFCELD